MTSSHLPVDVSIGSSDSFPAFAQLPLELRLFIWELATLTPRRVSLNTSMCCDPYPAILKVNHESRALVLKSYVDICPPKKLSLRTTHPRQYRFLNLEIDFAVVRLVELVGGHRDWRELEEPLGMWNNRKEVVQGVTRMVIEGNQFLYMSIVEAQSQLGLAGVRPKRLYEAMLEFQGLEEVVLEIQGLQDPWARDVVKDTVKDTAMCVQVEQDFVVYFDALPKKPKIKVRIVDL
jgi:hypothetical protein